MQLAAFEYPCLKPLHVVPVTRQITIPHLLWTELGLVILLAWLDTPVLWLGKLASVVWWLCFLPLEPRFAGSNPAEDDGFFSAIKSLARLFVEKVKPSTPCRKILRNVKEPYRIWRIILRHNLPPSFFWLATRFSAGTYQRALVDESGMIRTYMGTHN
jgi:hypothetical protein